MLSLKEFKEILEKHGEKYTEEEIRNIREILEKLGGIAYEIVGTDSFKKEDSSHLHKS